MIEVAHLSKSYATGQVLDDVSFEARPGRVVGLLGRNGAGKSTTISIMLGLVAGAGRVTFGGRLLNQVSRREIGVVLSPPSLNPRVTVHCAFASALAIRGNRSHDDLLGRLGLTLHREKRVRQLSLGLQQRVALAILLVGDPSYIILDEPTTGLDVEGTQLFLETVRALANSGSCVVVSSHQLPELAELADDLVVIDQGKTVASCTVADFVNRWGQTLTIVHSDDPTALSERLTANGFTPQADDSRAVVLRGDVRRNVGQISLNSGIALSELSLRQGNLQEAFLRCIDPSTNNSGPDSDPGLGSR